MLFPLIRVLSFLRFVSSPRQESISDHVFLRDFPSFWFTLSVLKVCDMRICWEDDDQTRATAPQNVWLMHDGVPATAPQNVWLMHDGVPAIAHQKVCLMQDGVPAQFSIEVRSHLHATYPGQ
ncbi:hypothetical protein TNCV_4030991 [Trichonephila clavipes]|nr:hypothetical protein TNCV_4030991 [Trichonephila clavipes]